MRRTRRILATAALAVGLVAATGCEIYDSDSNGVYDDWEIEQAVWRWWNCDILGPFLGDFASWSCNPHL